MNLKVSIITVCFNSEHTIKETIESVKNQTYKNYEHIIIDGKSKDKTLDIVKSYCNNSDNIKYISESDTGIYNAMNKGIFMASGELIVFLNSDDTFKKNALETIIRYFDKDKTDIIYGNVAWQETFYNKTYIKYLNLQPLGVAPYESEVMSLNHLDKIKNAHNATFVKAKIMKDNLFDENLKICSDYKFFLKMYKQDRKVMYIPKTITTMKMGGVSTTQLEKGIEEHVKCELDILKETHVNIEKSIRKIRFNKYVKSISKRLLPKKIYIKLRYLNKGWKLSNE